MRGEVQYSCLHNLTLKMQLYQRQIEEKCIYPFFFRREAEDDEDDDDDEEESEDEKGKGRLSAKSPPHR